MNEWLDLMLGEIDRKNREAEEAEDECERRRQSPVGAASLPRINNRGGDAAPTTAVVSGK